MKFKLMVLGRIIFGIGCESMYVGQSAIVSDWFIKYELPLAMSMISCVPLIGSFLGGAIIPQVYHKNLKPNDLSKAFGSSFAVGFLVCIFCFCLVVILSILDKNTSLEEMLNNKLEKMNKK